MKRITILFAVMTVLLHACSSKVDEKKATDKYEKGKLTLAEVEQQSPARFISVSGSDRKNILGQIVIRGKVMNNAKMVSYKDIEIKLSFFSKTGVLLEEDQETIYETLAPGMDKSFKTKYFAPKHTDSVALKVIAAKVESSK